MHIEKTVGQVHLVGAGPGDPELVTLKAQRLITSCDALVYDALVNPEIVDWAAKGCQRIYVGKRPGQPCMKQAQITDMLLQLARDGKTVVRLKGGDPFIFGRGGEEALALQSAGIPYSIVPGVSASLAASSYAGAPLTHRGISAAVTFLSGHEDPAKGGTLIDWRAHAQSGATLCLYMAMRKLDWITSELMAGGLKPETPALAVQWASTTQHQQVRTTLGELLQAVHDHSIESPAIVIIGEVARLADVLDWFSASQHATLLSDR